MNPSGVLFSQAYILAFFIPTEPLDTRRRPYTCPIHLLMCRNNTAA